MMQMLSAGGMSLLTDGQRSPDANNPRGYYELESVKSLPKDPRVIAEGEGKVVKVISSLLMFLPAERQYSVIFMRRPLVEVLASQDRMMRRLAREVPPAPTEAVAGAFERHLKQIGTWLSKQPNMRVLYVDYAAVLEDPTREASNICAFLGLELDVQAMVCRVEHSLHRERSLP